MIRPILLTLLAALPLGTRLDGARFEKYAGEFAYGLNVLPPWADQIVVATNYIGPVRKP